MEAKKWMTLNEVKLLADFSDHELQQVIQDGVCLTETIDGKEMVNTNSYVELMRFLGKSVPDSLIDDITKVLIVDDDENVAKAIKRQLDLNDNVISYIVLNGFELGYKLESVRPHILILDYNMPGMNGLDILKGLRASKDTKETKVIIHSGYLTNKLISQMEELQVSGIVNKGKDTSSLIDKVLELVK